MVLHISSMLDAFLTVLLPAYSPISASYQGLCQSRKTLERSEQKLQKTPTCRESPVLHTI